MDDLLVPTTFDWQASAANDTSWRGKARSWIVHKPDRAGTLQSNKTLAVCWLPANTEPSEEPDVTDASQMSMFSAEDSPAKTSRWLDAVKGWLVSGQDFSTSSCASLVSLLPVGFSSRTSLVFSRRTTEGTWESSWESWPTSGTGGRTGCLTLNTSEWPSAAVVCSLSDVLVDGPTVPRRYFLSPRAAAGILRRAERRGRELPPALLRALQAVAA